MRLRVYPYKQGSRSAKALAEAIGGKVLKLEGSRFRSRINDYIINWGSSQFFGDNYHHLLNGGGVVQVAGNKLLAFNRFREMGVPIPDFWTNKDDIPDEAFPIVCRTILNGHSGAGIVIAESRAALVDAPLYVRYVKKQDEYRVHIFQGRAIAVQQKRRRMEHPDPNWQVRNHANGFVYTRDNVQSPDPVLECARSAIEALGLDFGAVDIIWNNRNSLALVLEVNTAPGLEGSTVNDYAEAIGSYVRGR